MPVNDTALDRLKLAIRQVDPTNEAGAWQLITSGTINIVGGGSGGTSSVDNNPFTPGGTSVTPAGGYQGGRQVSSGNVGAFAISPSGLLLVDVRAGGAGGGQANLTVRGTANSDIQVGYASGAGPNVAGGAYVPILGTVNLGAGAAPFASVAVYGSPANPVYVIGSVNIVNPVGIFGSVTGIASVNVGNAVGIFGSVTGIASVNVGNAVGIFGSVNVLGTVTLAAGAAPFASVAVYGSPANPVYVVGSVNVVNAVGVQGSVSVSGTATIVPPTNFTVWLANQNAGSGFASAAVYGSPANPVYVVGSVNVVNAVGVQGSVSVSGTATIVPPTNFTVWLANQNAGAGFASVAVYGSPANPVYIIGSANVVGGGGSLGVTQIGAPWGVVGSVGVTPLVSFTVNMGGIPTVNLGLGTVNVGNPVGIFGSVNVLGSVNIGGIPIVDVRGSMVPTIWIISGAASGVFAVASAAGANLRYYFSSYHLVADGTADIQWMSPSGTAISGSMRLLPGAGFAMAGNFPNGPVLFGSLNSSIALRALGTLNVGGVAIGWVGP